MKKYPWVGEALLYLVILGVYASLHYNSVFADPDSFYHLKLAELIVAEGPVRSFLWLPFTTLGQNYADHHFLYHVALIPFIKALGPLAALQASSLIFACLAVVSVSWALRTLVPLKNGWLSFAPLFALMLGIMGPFAFRINLAKASSLGVILLVVGITLVLTRRVIPLAIVSFIYVWTHGGWPALLVCGTLAAALCTTLKSADARREDCLSPARPRDERRTSSTASATGARDVMHMLLALWGGAVAGLIINPFFPNNLRFYWEQIVQIAVVGYRNTIGVGGEWYPYSLVAFFTDQPLLWILVVLAVLSSIVVSVREKQIDRVGTALSVIAFLFALMTLRSQRHIEYFVPLAVLASGYWIERARTLYYHCIYRHVAIYAPIVVVLSLGLAAMVTGFAKTELERTRFYLSSGYDFTRFERASAFLKNNAAGEVVVHADWDDFPLLFYWNSESRYIMGLDPTFLYRANPILYKEYVDFTLGNTTDPVMTMHTLDARFVFMDWDHEALRMLLERSGAFKKVYEDDEAYVYQLK